MPKPQDWPRPRDVLPELSQPKTSLTHHYAILRPSQSTPTQASEKLSHFITQVASFEPCDVNNFNVTTTYVMHGSDLPTV